jgi:hypothetical protein
MKNGTSGFRMAHPGGAEGAEKRFFIKKYSELCELGVSVVNTPYKREQPCASTKRSVKL